MITVAELTTHLARIDGLVDTIAECEAFLDEYFPGIKREAVPFPAVRGAESQPRSEEDIAEAVAERIKREREARGWRQQDLSDITGIARPNIARLESGRRMPKISTLQKIAGALGLRMEELID